MSTISGTHRCRCCRCCRRRSSRIDQRPHHRNRLGRATTVVQRSRRTDHPRASTRHRKGHQIRRFPPRVPARSDADQDRRARLLVLFLDLLSLRQSEHFGFFRISPSPWLPNLMIGVGLANQVKDVQNVTIVAS
ncbi:hypothetical protein LR48_Vigan406s000200 [Vigna angularis]|uniref:Uncharacterized protein n=1 Tax=Phaseolus angularis TaxID=3914 RepID=A0A0L9T9F4_PHAAN|nr:hypothetical protein LR48_Vigan406s000200 [Vigna angularis]